MRRNSIALFKYVREKFVVNFRKLSFLLFASLLEMLVVGTVSARKLDDIYWNSSNPMFEISNTQHVKTVELLDRVTIICPHTTNSRLRYEFTKLFMVSRESYDSCELHEDARQLGVCATPQRHSSISIVFRPFSALSSLLQFQAGHSYYVITTSDGTEAGLNKTSGGLCLTRNMKIKFDLLKDNSQEEKAALSASQEPRGWSRSEPILYEVHEIQDFLNNNAERSKPASETQKWTSEGDTSAASPLLRIAARSCFAAILVALFKIFLSPVIL